MKKHSLEYMIDLKVRFIISENDGFLLQIFVLNVFNDSLFLGFGIDDML